MYFIYNPHAGMERIRSNLLDIIDIFSRDGYEVTVCPTRKRGDGTEATVKMKEGYDILVCCGGDGTLDEVVAGMMKRSDRIPIGYVPAGSTNDFARTLQIPSNMQRAAEVISEGREFKCDIGSFNDRPFVYVAAFGLFTKVAYSTDQNMKNALEFNKNTMRVLGLVDIERDNSNGKITGAKLALVNEASNTYNNSLALNNGYIPANKVYLPISSSDAAATANGIKLLLPDDYAAATSISKVTCEDKPAQEGVYTLTGIKVKDTNSTDNLPSGIYIINGKKQVIK